MAICLQMSSFMLYCGVAAAAAKSLQSCPTLCDSMDCSLPGSSVHGIFQARVLEWVAIAFSLEAIIKITLWIEGLSEYGCLCERVWICECVCREQCKKTQHWLFIYLHKIYSGYKKIKCCRLSGIHTWSRCVGGIFPRSSKFGKETDKIGNNAEKTRFIWIQNRKKISPSETKIICFFSLSVTPV